MATLVANNSETPISRIDLQQGINTVGRAEGNHHVIQHGSISSRHCEIVWNDGAITVRDLGSTNGTFVEDKSVQRENLVHGQRLRFGAVEFIVEAPELITTPKAEPVRVSLPKATAVSTPEFVPVGRTAAEAISAIRPEFYVEPSFYAQIPGAFSYPLKKSGIILLILGTILFVVLDFLSSAARPSFSGRIRVTRFSLLISAITIGYLFAYMQRIISHSAQGEDELPDFPDVSEWWSDILQPFLFFAGTLVVSLSPALAAIFATSQNEIIGLAFFPALALGAFYFPMALLAVAVTDNFLGLSPHVVLPSITRVFLPYCATFLLLVMLVGVRIIGGIAVDAIPWSDFVIRIPLILFLEFASLYVLTVEMRILGLLFRSNRERLGWL